MLILINKKLKMKKLNLIIILLFSLLSINITNATIEESNIIIKEETKIVSIEESITRQEAFEYLGVLIDEIPNSYKYIHLNYKNIEPSSKIEDALKKIVYLDRLPNSNIDLKLEEKITALEFYSFAIKFLNLWFFELDEEILGARWVSNEDLIYIRDSYYVFWEKEEEAQITISPTESSLWTHEWVFSNMIETIKNYHYDKDNFNEDDLIYWALQWLANATNDNYTSYFPPIESKSFMDSLSSEISWIWAYVEMPSPWVVRIQSPIPWSPSEKAGIKWGDIIIKVDDKEISKDNSLEEVTSWIKWEKWTKVKVTINRDWEIKEIEVERDIIIIKNIEIEDYLKTIYIKINNFNEWVWKELKEVIENINKTKTDKIIIDLRNNWWGFLHEANEILWYFIDKWELLSVLKTSYWENENYYSQWPKILNLNNFEVVILQNSWTASASEIMIWTLLDYYPEITTIWEKTFWKGSAQSIVNYTDGTSFKFTFAKWFTWKTETWIDGVGIEPKIELELDYEEYINSWKDNQLEKAINY